jgi:hypothetical protein
MRGYTATIKLSQNKFDEVNGYINSSIPVPDCGMDERLELWEIEYKDVAINACIEVCNSDSGAWCEAVWFDNAKTDEEKSRTRMIGSDSEIGYSDPAGDLTSEFILEDEEGDCKYILKVEVE